MDLWTRPFGREGSEGSTGPKGKVDGPTGRRLWPPDGGGLCRRVEKGKVLRIDGPFRAQGFLSLTALRAEGCGIALSGDEYKASVTGFAFLHHRA